MNNHEKNARELRSMGLTCSEALHKTFSKDLNLNDDFPAPRSIDGKCGAVLTAIKILQDTGHNDKIEEFEKWFLERFGYLKCAELMAHDRRCIDYIGETAQKLDEYLGIGD